jgi:hypothetical protein
MVIPPVLDVFVLWHPDDEDGSKVLGWLSEHFHSAAFSGLAGGAVEVYGRSEGWDREHSAPRPFGIETPVAGLLPRAQFNAIVPVMGINLLRAVRDDPTWGAYLEEVARLNSVKGVGIYPVRVDGTNLGGSALSAKLATIQTLPDASMSNQQTFARELSQAITQDVEAAKGLDDHRIRVFVSHTKHDSLEESDQDGPALFEAVRQVIASTRLSAFFDAQDLQSGAQWKRELDNHAADCALLMVRTDKYSGREWTQREVLTAKRHDVPIVGMYALTEGEERGSFLMDHVPSVPCNVAEPHSDIEIALNRLVDEALKRALWKAQAVYLGEHGFDWMPVHSPEPVTLAPWLAKHKKDSSMDDHLWILHPDPPLGPNEHEVLVEICELAGFGENVDVLTPRTFSARGGRLRK